MWPNKPLPIFIGWDSREPVAAEVCSYSIKKRTNSQLSIHYLKHRDLRQRGLFARPWRIESITGNYVDDIDTRPFSTEFSHTRFLVPKLMNYTGWALFMDSDMIVLSDIKKLFDLCDDKYAVMCVKHTHIPLANAVKMDAREQMRYHRKNWSSFVLWNCGHPANLALSPEKVSFKSGGWLHAFSWLADNQIGDLPFSYNYIAGVSPKYSGMPDVVHYTEGGPWFPECEKVAYAGTWMEEYEDWQINAQQVCDVPTVAFEKEDKVRK